MGKIYPDALIAYTGVGFCVAVRLPKAMREASIRRTVTDTDSYAFFVKQPNANEGMTAAHKKKMTTDGYHLYRVEFVYKEKSYSCEFYSTAEITPNTDPLVAWGIADDAIKTCMASIPNRVKGVYPHSIVLYGEFGNLTIKD